jgi:hypothetical protein
MWHPLYFACYKPGDKPCMRKGPDSDYDKRNISMVMNEIVLVA